MKPAIALAAIAVTLAGCNAAGTAPNPAAPGPKLTIGQVAQGDFTTACQTFNVAVGYYDDVALFVPASAQATASLVIDAGHGAAYVVCATEDYSAFGPGFTHASCDLQALNPPT